MGVLLERADPGAGSGAARSVLYQDLPVEVSIHSLLEVIRSVQ